MAVNVEAPYIGTPNIDQPKGTCQPRGQGDVEGRLADMVGALGTIVATTKTNQIIQIKTIMNGNIELV